MEHNEERKKIYKVEQLMPKLRGLSSPVVRRVLCAHYTHND